MIRSSSRWWYWIAAVPVVVAFWLLSTLWVAVSAWLKFTPGELFGSVGETAILVPLVALGLPLAALFGMLPYAIFRDGNAIHAAGSSWPPTGRYAGAATLGLVLVVSGLALVELSGPALGSLVALLGVLLDTGVSIHYVRARREHVHMPASLREWREELRPR